MPDSSNKIWKAFTEYRDVLVRALLRTSIQPADVDDILQESFARTLEADSKKHVQHPKSYLFIVSRNIAFREQQKRAREIQREIDDIVMAADEAPADQDLYYSQMLSAFWEALETLPLSHQRAILLRRVYGLSYEQIAKKMNKSVSSVEKYFARGIKRTQDIMSGRGYGIEFMDGAPSREGVSDPTRRTRRGGEYE